MKNVLAQRGDAYFLQINDKDAGLVIHRAAGSRRIYQLRADGLAAVRADLDRF